MSCHVVSYPLCFHLHPFYCRKLPLVKGNQFPAISLHVYPISILPIVRFQYFPYSPCIPPITPILSMIIRLPGWMGVWWKMPGAIRPDQGKHTSCGQDSSLSTSTGCIGCIRCWRGGIPVIIYAFHALFLIARQADEDSMTSYIVTMGRQIAKMLSKFSLWGSLFLMGLSVNRRDHGKHIIFQGTISSTFHKCHEKQGSLYCKHFGLIKVNEC